MDNKSGDDLYIEMVSEMGMHDLVKEVMENPEYLTDSYYHKFGNAIRTRYNQLTASKDLAKEKFVIDPEGYQIPALNFILEERTLQDDKWGEQNHTMPIWLTILMEEVGEVAKAVLENKRSDSFKETVQVCAVALAMLECYLRHDASDKWWFGQLDQET